MRKHQSTLGMEMGMGLPMGGRGSIVGAFIGVLIISVLQNGLAQLGVSEPVKRLITGLVIILAVLLDRWRSR